MSVTFVQEFGAIVGDVQTELVFFFLAVATHFLFFHKLRPAARHKSGKDPNASAASNKQQMTSKGTAPNLCDLKAAIKAGDLKTVLSQLEDLEGLWQNQSSPSPSSAPAMLMEQIVKLVLQNNALSDFLQLLTKMSVLDDTFDVVLSHCADQGDAAILKAVQKFGISRGVKFSSAGYQALIKGASKYGSQADAEMFLSQAREAGVADGATFNAYMNILLKWGKNKEVQKVIETMRSDGVKPSCIAFNKLLGAAVASDSATVWSIVDHMKACEVKPDQYTCAILLKSRCINSKASGIEKVIAFLSDVEEDMDDVLFNSIVDACVRVGRADLLIPFLKTQRSSSNRSRPRSAHTYGSIIRAYGSVQDIRGAWNTWEEMKRQHVTPISVTVGCMVEALVANGDVEGGYELVQEMCRDEKTANLVNAAVYGSMVKGFSHKKCFTRMWDVYNEMVSKKLQFSMVTFNTIIDGCCRSGELNQIPSLLKDIESQGLKMGLVTYSVILKGYCQKNMLDEAFQLFHDMNENAGLEPDEIMYNSLLDGCARQGLYDRGMKLFRKMEKSGVRPSNYTLSVLVKMANRGKKLDKAFELCTELSSKYDFRMNVHVFANLIQACIQHRDVSRGMNVLEQMVQERVRPDVRCYSLLLKACVENRRASDADGLLRAATGLSNPHPCLAIFAKSALRPQDSLPQDLISEILTGLIEVCGKQDLAAALAAELGRLPGHKLDPKLRLRLATSITKH